MREIEKESPPSPEEQSLFLVPAPLDQNDPLHLFHKRIEEIANLYKLTIGDLNGHLFLKGAADLIQESILPISSFATYRILSLEELKQEPPSHTYGNDIDNTITIEPRDQIILIQMNMPTGVLLTPEEIQEFQDSIQEITPENCFGFDNGGHSIIILGDEIDIFDLELKLQECPQYKYQYLERSKFTTFLQKSGIPYIERPEDLPALPTTSDDEMSFKSVENQIESSNQLNDARTYVIENYSLTADTHFICVSRLSHAYYHNIKDGYDLIDQSSHAFEFTHNADPEKMQLHEFETEIEETTNAHPNIDMYILSDLSVVFAGHQKDIDEAHEKLGSKFHTLRLDFEQAIELLSTMPGFTTEEHSKHILTAIGLSYHWQVTLIVALCFL